MDAGQGGRGDSRLQAGYLLGIAKVKGRVKTLLDIDRVVAADELEQIAVTAV